MTRVERRVHRRIWLGLLVLYPLIALLGLALRVRHAVSLTSHPAPRSGR